MGNAFTYCTPQENKNKKKNEVHFRIDESFKKFNTGRNKIKKTRRLNDEFQLYDNKSKSLNRNLNKEVFRF